VNELAEAALAHTVKMAATAVINSTFRAIVTPNAIQQLL
jgi:hypothetical protein